MGKARNLAALIPLLVISAITFAEDQADATDPSIACVKALDSKPELIALQGKVALSDVRTQTLEMLSNDKKPTRAEKAAISQWVKALDECGQVGNDWRQKYYPPQLNFLVDQYFSDMKSLTADLYSGKITYGAFAKSRASALVKMTSDMTEAVQRVLAERKAEQEKRDQQARDDQYRQQQLDAQQEASRLAAEQQDAQMRAQADQARRNMALQFLMNQRPPLSGYQVQQPYQAPLSTSTNCMPNGIGGFNCTTR